MLAKPRRLTAEAGFEWAKLPENSLVVDVGGGVGNLTMALAKTYKHLRYVLQDRHATAQTAETVRATSDL